MYASQRLRSLLAALFLLSLIALTVLPARAATHTVTDCGDNGGAGQLRTLINSAAGGDTINIPACTITLTGAANDNANASGDLDIGKDLTLVGAGPGSTRIRGGNLDRVLHITGAFTVAISNMTITDGNVSGVSDSGGGISNFGLLTLTNVVVTYNTANFTGGGLANNNVLTLNDSYVGNNTATTGMGGGIANNGNLNVDNSTIDNNSALGSTGVGGGIANNLTLNINNSTISGNLAANYGGGINNNGTLTVNNSILGNNIASNNAGGGIYNDVGTLTINASTLSGNSSLNGGGIYTIRGTVIITNSTFSGNSAEPSNGSGGGIASSSPGTVTITNSTVSNNSAFYGGGIAAITNVTIRNTIIANSAAGGDCAGALADGGHNIVEDNSCGFTGGSDPLLGPLANNGGLTKTHALLSGSPAIDAGSNAVCAAGPVNNLDQRGLIRPQGAVCDIGAFELETYFSKIDLPLANANHGSLAWSDYDNDGDDDLLQTGRGSSGYIAKLYRNDNGLLTDVNAPFVGVEGGSADWGDYDGDGDLDVALMGFNGNTPEGYFAKVYRNDNGAFTDINAALPGTAYGTVDWGDYDHDGDPDILLNGEPISGRITRVYRNNGGVFTDINASLAGTVYGSAAWGDYDNDNDLDILVTGDGISNSKVYRNDGGTFTDINANLIFSRLGKGVWGDYDNDGDLDILISGAGSKLYRNDGADTFTDSGVSLVQFDDSAAAWGDFDNDGKLDFVIGGRNYSDLSRSSAIYRNTGNGNFTLITYLYNVGANAAAWGDLDNDGDLDLALSGQDTNGAPLTRFYRNNLLTPSVIPPPPTLNFPDTVHPPQSPRPLFDWNNVPNATYTLQVAANRNFTALVINLNLSSSAHIPTTHLPRSTTLYWRVRANNAFGVSAWSLVKSFDSPNPPNAPILLTPNGGVTVSSLKPTLDWTDSLPTPERYEVQIATDSGFVNILGRGQGGPTAQLQYTPEAQLAGDTVYYWRARAFGGASPNGQLLFGEWSATGSFKTP
jgi:hypothetical protein